MPPPPGSSLPTASPISTAPPKAAASAAMNATTRVGGPPCTPVSCSTAWPLPFVISQRLTGKATTPATTRATDSAPQKRMSPTPAPIAPGISSMSPLSTTSMTAIEKVSVARAIGTTVASAKPARSSGRLVSE